jgi:hypothetical protein
MNPILGQNNPLTNNLTMKDLPQNRTYTETETQPKEEHTQSKGDQAPSWAESVQAPSLSRPKLSPKEQLLRRAKQAEFRSTDRYATINTAPNPNPLSNSI